MSASDNLQPKQLKMFMSPNELKAEGYIPNPIEARGSDLGGSIKEPPGTTPSDRMMARKLQEAKTTGLHGQIEVEGVQRPISVVTPAPGLTPPPALKKLGFNSSTPMIGNGHHRLAAQADIDPDRLMPIMHNERLATGVMEDLHGDHLWNTRDAQIAAEQAKSSLRPYPIKPGPVSSRHFR